MALIVMMMLCILKIVLTKSALMDSKLNQALFSGVIATVFMSLIMYVFSLFGLPEVHPPAMLSDIMSISIVLSWMLHFSIGFGFAMFYMFVFSKIVKKVKTKFYKGVIFGITLFIVAQITITVLGLIFKNVSVRCDFPEGSPVIADHAASMLRNGCNTVSQGGTKAMISTIILSLVGHICYGVAVVYSILKPKEK